MRNVFLPLAGADEVGGSSYFVKLEGVNVLFDCGARPRAQFSYPNYSLLLEEQMDDFGQLDLILISHAHYDHIGSLYSIAAAATNARIMATRTTKELMRLQLIDFERSLNPRENEKIRKLKLQRVGEIIDKIIEVPVMTSIKHQSLSITFYPAGHMAGACMIGLEGERYKLLYTGDFSFKTILGMNKLNLGGYRPDIMILNATYGYTPGEGKGFDYAALELRINELLQDNKRVLLKSTGIAKHLELFYALKMMEIKGDCYLHKSSEQVAECFSRLSYDVYSSKLKADSTSKPSSHVMIASEDLEGYEEIIVDKYSLHASIEEIIKVIYNCWPKEIYVVHTVVKEENKSFIDIIEREGLYNGKIIQCHNEISYEIGGCVHEI